MDEQDYPDDYDDEDDWEDPEPDDDDEEGEAELGECPKCGADIYEESERCPLCGEYIRPTTHSAFSTSGPLMRWGAILALIGMSVGCLWLFW